MGTGTPMRMHRENCEWWKNKDCTCPSVAITEAKVSTVGHVEGPTPYPLIQIGGIPPDVWGGARFYVNNILTRIDDPLGNTVWMASKTLSGTCGECAHWKPALRTCGNSQAMGYAWAHLSPDNGCLLGFTPRTEPR